MNIDHKYIYFLFGLALLVVWIALYLLRPDLRVKLLRTSAVGIFAGPLAEFWYFQDYWRPPMFLVLGQVTIEDVLVGFCITGIAVVIYDVVFRTRIVPGAPRYKRTFILFFLAGLAGLTIFARWLEINSMFVSSVGFVVFAAIIVALRPDLLRVSIWSGVLCLGIVLPIYILLFDVVAPDYWPTHKRLDGSALDLTLPGSSIPILEVSWYFTWGLLAGIGYEFAGGRRKVPFVRSAAGAAGVPSVSTAKPSDAETAEAEPVS